MIESDSPGRSKARRGGETARDTMQESKRSEEGEEKWHSNGEHGRP